MKVYCVRTYIVIKGIKGPRNRSVFRDVMQWSIQTRLHGTDEIRAFIQNTFEQMPKSITYTYDVKYKNQRMDVTITLSKAKDDRKLYINETNFPDDYFRTYLTEELLASVVEYDEEGFYVFESDAEAITEINILDENIRSLKGIEYFTGVTNLNCEGNQLTALDLSGNCNLRNVTVQGQLATTKVGYRMETMARRSVEAGATYLVYLDTSDATLNNAKVVQVLVYGEDGSQQNASYVEELDAWRCTKKPVRVTYYYDVNVPGQRVLMDVTAETVELEEEAPAIAADLVFNRGSLSLQSYIAFNLTAKNSVLENYDSWYVVFERYDHFSQAVITETVESIAYGTSNQLFEYKVSSYMMSDSITATLYAMKDGVTYKGEVYEESVESFVLSLMDNADEDQATLYTNLLTYGSEAQTFLGYNTSALADAKLNEYTSYTLTAASDVESLYAETSKGLTGATKNKLALGISSAVQIQLRVDLDASYDVNTVYGELTYIRGNETITQRIDGKDFSESGSRYVLIFDAITAVDGRTPVQITIFDQNGNAISETWTYSISSYLVDGGLEGNALATMEALLNYFDSAAKVFGA